MNWNKKNFLIVFVIVLIAAAGIGISRTMTTRRAASAASVTETAVVQRGDLSVTVDAAGSLTPLTEITLAFPVAGRIYEISVSEGQTVKQGDVLARTGA
ncbi:MAG: biotin/lipoyl-binding protein [Anaerolineales bacterium]|nr:biotin/lipoyl-binding protein [Anaerolineales bacterium]